MKFSIRGSLFFSILLIGFFLVSVYPQFDPAAEDEKEAVLMRTVLTYLDNLHFEPKSLDDQFSQEFFDLYMERLDPDRRFFTAEDLKQFEPYKKLLDDEALAGKFDFFDLSLDRYLAALEKTQGFYREILAEPFGFSVAERIEMDGEKRGFAQGDEELHELWRKYLKLRVLNRLVDKLNEQEEAGEEKEKRSLEALEAEARADELEQLEEYYDRVLKINRIHRRTYYINTLTNLYDPHSDYLEPIDKEDFNIRFSGRLEGIGATLQNDGDDIKVVRIIVGGPAWKQKELEENDRILRVTQEDGEVTELTGMLVKDAVQYIRGPKGTEVTLTVKKIDGTIQDITIVRDVVIIEESFARSLILDGPEEGERVGFISLPSFYADFENADGRFSAKDVKKEIEKLQEEGVDGIILDLRFNGGGSLRDVVKMAGYFIEKGPIVQVKSRRRSPDILEDKDPRVQYDGPLIIMVNGFSASASEIMAAAMQDYGRAVIVGSKSTYGKGTVQRFFDLDQGVRGHSDLKPLGEIKLTTQKFYRVNGGSTQLRGVVPDIVLPDQYHLVEVGEKEQDYAMPWSEINPVSYEQHVMNIQDLDELRARSEARVAGDPMFQKILENAERVHEQQEQSQYPLELQAFREMEEENRREADQFEDMFESEINQGIHNLETDLEKIRADESKKARNEDWIETVAKDIYIKETLNIMHDLISMN